MFKESLKKKALFKFDILSFCLGLILYFLFCLEIKVDLIKNIDLLSWPSANNRPLVFLYVFSHFYIFTRLLIVKTIENKKFNEINYFYEPNKNKFFVKIIISLFLVIFIYYGIFYQYYNDGLGTYHVSRSLNDHLTVILAPLNKIQNGEKFYLEAETGLIGPLQQLFFFWMEDTFKNATDIYRFQLVINFVSLSIVACLLIFMCDLKWGLILFLSIILTKVGILSNFNYPGWGFYLRWFPLLIMSIYLTKILYEFENKKLLIRLFILSIFWSLLALVAKENFLQPIIAIGIIFYFQFYFLQKKLIFFKNLFYLIIFFLINFTLFSVTIFGIENLKIFFSLYTDFTSRYFWGQNSLFLTDTRPLFQDPFALFVVGKVYLSVIFQIFLGLILFSKINTKKINKNFYIVIISVLAASVSLNMASFFRADLTHIKSTGMLTVALIILSIVFYLRHSIKTSVGNFIFFLMFIILIVDIHYSIPHTKNIVKSLINYQKIDNSNSFFQPRENFNKSISYLITNKKILKDNFKNHGEIKDSNLLKEWHSYKEKLLSDSNDTDVNILRKVSSDINEQRYFFMRYNQAFKKMINFKEIIKDKPLVAWDYNFPDFRVETLIYLLELNTAGNISSPMTNIWNKKDLENYIKYLFASNNYCFYLNDQDLNNLSQIKEKWFLKSDDDLYFLNNQKIPIKIYLENYKESNQNHFLCND